MQTPRSLEDIPFVTDFPDDYNMQSGTFLARMYEKHGSIFRGKPFQNEWVYLVGPGANRFILSSSSRLKFSHYQGWGTRHGRCTDAR